MQGTNDSVGRRDRNKILYYVMGIVQVDHSVLHIQMQPAGYIG